MSEARDRILSIIRSIRRCWRRRELAMAAAVGGVGLLLWLAGMIIIDNQWMLSSRELVAGWAAAAAAGAAGIALLAYRLTLGRPSARDLALQFERRVSGQHNRLINSIDFIERGAADGDAMARAAVVENALRLDSAAAPRAIDWTGVRLAGLALAISAVVVLGYALWRGTLALNALARILHPGDPPPHLLATRIAVAPGDVRLIEGDTLLIEAKLAGYLPPAAQVEYRMGQGAWTGAAMEAVDPATFRYGALRGVWQDIEYRVVAGRTTSAKYTARVQRRPRVESVQVAVTPPEYTGQSQQWQPADHADVTALPGSSVLVKVTASTELSSAKLEMSDGRTVNLSLGGPRVASGTFVLNGNGWYSVNIADRSAPTPLTNLSPPRFGLAVQEDQPPTGVFTAPGRDLILPADAVVDLKLEAEDDWGLAHVAIETKSANRDWASCVEEDLKPPGERKRVVTARLTLEQLNLKSGDLLLYRAVASDHRKPQPNVFVGRPWSIAIGSATADSPLLAGEAKRALESLQEILKLQKEARQDVEMDRAVEPIRGKQERVRQMTLSSMDAQRSGLRPMQAVIDELGDLADGPMVKASALLAAFGGSYEQRLPAKPAILQVQDEIIARLEELVGRVGRAVGQAERMQQAIEKLSPEQREQAMKQIRDMLEKLRKFIPEQDKVIADTQELIRRADNFTEDDLAKIEKLAGTEDQWAKVFAGSTKEMEKLLQQGFADATIADDYKQMVEQIEEAARNLTPEIKTIVVPREQAGLELAKEIKEDMEMWLPSTPDDTKWVMEEPLEMPEVPMPPLPENLRDLIGDLIAEESEMTEEADDQTSAWADSMSAAGWGTSDGPISNFSARGVTGNQLPNNQELTGRAGDGRSGKSSGQMVQDVARGLEGRKTPTRVTNDPYEQGVVKELQQMQTGGATGGGKARGAGQEGLQGSTPPPSFDKLPFMKDWQQRIRQKAERVAAQLKSVHLHVQELDRSIELMKQAEAAAKDGRYGDMFKAQQMVLGQLRAAEDLAARDASLHVDPALNVPADRRSPVLDAGDEPVPAEYHGAVKRYFEQLSRER